jgi:hypothetical protein
MLPPNFKLVWRTDNTISFDAHFIHGISLLTSIMQPFLASRDSCIPENSWIVKIVVDKTKALWNLASGETRALLTVMRTQLNCLFLHEH